MTIPLTLPELVARSQEADIRLAEEQYLREKAAREELEAKRRMPNEVSLSGLMKKMYGEDAVPPAASLSVPPKPGQETKNERPKTFEPFPPPPTGRK